MEKLDSAGHRPMNATPKADKVFTQNTTPKMVKAPKYVGSTRDEKSPDIKGSK